jgi:hypothetical protein
VPVPWLQIVDAALGFANFARGRASRTDTADTSRQIAAGAPTGPIEARLAGVVVAALKEAFDRDTRRLELEREQMAAERRRAERAMRAELLRQAGERAISRFQLVAGVAAVTWIGSLFFSARAAAGTTGARVALGCGWLLMLAGLALAFAAQSNVAASLHRATIDADGPPPDVGAGGTAGALAPWLLVVGLAVLAVAVLIA